MTKLKSPLAAVRKEANPPWPPASTILSNIAHKFAALWCEFWEYQDEGRWFLEGEVETVCNEIEELRSIIATGQSDVDLNSVSTDIRVARAELQKRYIVIMRLQKRLRGWTANCRTYRTNLLKDRRALISLIKSEGHSLESIGLDRWKYWYMGTFNKLGREEKVFHLPLQEFIQCGGVWEQHGDNSRDYSDIEDEEESTCSGDEYLDEGLVLPVDHVDEVRWDDDHEVYYLVGI